MRRRLRVPFGYGLLALAMSACAAPPQSPQPLQDEFDTLGQCQAAAQDLSSAPLPVRALNANIFSWTSPDASARIFEALADLKVRYIRFDFLWPVVERSKGQRDWHIYDSFVRQAHDHGIQILAVALYAPPWANGDGPPQQPPSDVSDWADFVQALVTHYKPCGDFAVQQGWTDGYGIRAWEIWNEPNHPHFWTVANDPAGYARLLAGSYRAIKAIDPGAVVLNGGLVMSDRADCYAARCFLEGLYANGAKDSFDVMALHPYTKDPPHGIQASIGAVRAVMDANGDTNKPIWLTEFGYLSSYLTEGGQAAYLEQTYQVELPMAAAVNNVRLLFWYSLVDADDHPFGLVRADFSRKASYFKYRDAIAE